MRVQRKNAEGGTQNAGEIQGLATKGASGGGGKMPHADKIQSAFGHHDVSGVQSHQGGAAQEACAGMGASAYATGNDVVFGQEPSLHTAAHEAAHVVQQRSGVQLSGGVGAAGDSYEQHADKVADAVVSGGNAEGILDQFTGGQTTGGGGGRRPLIPVISSAASGGMPWNPPQ